MSDKKLIKNDRGYYAVAVVNGGIYGVGRTQNAAIRDALQHVDRSDYGSDPDYCRFPSLRAEIEDSLEYGNRDGQMTIYGCSEMLYEDIMAHGYEYQARLENNFLYHKNELED